MTELLVEEFATPGKLVGHLSYVLLIASMMMRSMKWLRILALSAGVVSIAYGFVLEEYVVIFWEAVFVLVNLVQLLLLEIQNRRARFSNDEERFIKAALPGVERAHCRKLLALAIHEDVEVGAELTTEGEPVQRLLFILEGAISIEKQGKIVGVCGHDDFLGELGFMLGTNASATAVVANSVRCLSFKFGPLRALLEKDPGLRHALEASFNRNVMGKLVKANASSEEFMDIGAQPA